MAEVVLATESERQIWDSDYLKESVRASRFAPYMGKGVTRIIIVKHELESEAGKTINIPLITRLSNKGVGGATALRGRETQIGNFNCPITIDWDRNGVVVPKSESYKTEIDFLNAAKPLLRQWTAEALRTDIIYAMMSLVTTGNTTVPYAEITDDTVNGGYQIATGYVAGSVFDRYEGVSWTTASEANKDSWLVANSDRVLFGKLRSNAVSLDHSTALATLDTTDDKLTTATASLAKRMAGNANPHITPFQVEDGREYYVMFCGPRSFRDLKLDTAMVSANRDARAREGSGMDKNPLFQDGDLIYDGIIFREVPEIPHIVGVGSSTDVEPNFLCGQQALGVAWGQTPTPQTEVNDYKFRPGVAIEELRGVKKLAFNGKQNGIVTVYTAAGADA
jgi:N4-gp56 family major capsid protein